MTICKTAYDTTACGGFVMRKTVDAIQVAFTHGSLGGNIEGGIWLIEGGTSMADAIPAFAHPLAFEYHTKEERVVVDVRGFGKWDAMQNVYRIRNEMEYQLAVHRGNLNRIWIEQSPTLLRDISQLPIAIFASWISEAIAKRFALDPREQLNLGILAAIFYLSLFSDVTELDEREKMRAVNAITRAMRASAADVLVVLDQISVVPNVAVFCQQAEAISGSVRLKELNVGLLYSVLGGTWFGTNAKEIVAVALEHPPTWLAILLAAYSERTYKNSAISKITERTGNKDSGKGYIHAVLNLLSHNAN